MTEPLEIVLPDTDDLEDGDVSINDATGAVHILRGGHWCLADVADRNAARETLGRWKAGDGQ